MATRKCCWGPMTDPGLAMRAHAIYTWAGTLYSSITASPIRVAVLPKPALQWTAMAPLAFLTRLKKDLMISGGGHDPSSKNMS